MLRGLLERVLKAQIRNALGVGGDYRIILFISAKSAIYTFVKGVRRTSKDVLALVPDHVCSAVPLAILETGNAEIMTYPSGEAMVPDAELLRAMIRKDSPDVLVLAPIFGAQGKAYSELIESMSRLEDGPLVLLDQAQHMDPPPVDLDAIVLSFHRKSVQGLNGGALLLRESFQGSELSPSRSISLGEEMYVALLLRNGHKSRASHKADGRVKGGFYHEGCEHFPGRIENAKMPLLSMAVAIMEMMRLEKYREIRRANFKILSERISKVVGCHLMATEGVDSASQIGVFVDDEPALNEMARSLAEVGIPVRRPYAKFDDPDSSAKPNLFSVPNPFFRIRD